MVLALSTSQGFRETEKHPETQSEGVGGRLLMAEWRSLEHLSLSLLQPPPPGMK